MKSIYTWIIDNKEWLFSGVGIIIIGIIWKLITKIRQEATRFLVDINLNSIKIQNLFLEVEKLNIQYSEQTKKISKLKMTNKAKSLRKRLLKAKKYQSHNLNKLAKSIGIIRGNMRKIKSSSEDYKSDELKSKAVEYLQSSEKEFQEISKLFYKIEEELKETDLKINQLNVLITSLEAKNIA